MLEETAIVLHGDGPRAWVAADASRACARCAAGRGCGAAALSRLFSRRASELEVSDPVGVRAGERVVIGVDETALLAAAAAVYLPPLLALLCGSVVGAAAGGETGALTGGVLGLAAGLWVARRWRRRGVEAVVLRRADAADNGQAPSAAA